MNFLVFLVAFVLAATAYADDVLPLVLVAKLNYSYHPISVLYDSGWLSEGWDMMFGNQFDAPVEFNQSDDKLLSSSKLLQGTFLGLSKRGLCITENEDLKISVKFNRQKRLISHSFMACQSGSSYVLKKAATKKDGCQDVQIYLLGFDKKGRTIQPVHDKKRRLETALTMHDTNSFALFANFTGPWKSLGATTLAPDLRPTLYQRNDLRFPFELKYQGNALMFSHQKWYMCAGQGESLFTISEKPCSTTVPLGSKNRSIGKMYTCATFPENLFSRDFDYDNCINIHICLFPYDRKTDSPKLNGNMTCGDE